MCRKKHWLNAIVGLIVSFTSKTNKSIEVTIYEFGEHFQRRHIRAYMLTYRTHPQTICSSPAELFAVLFPLARLFAWRRRYLFFHVPIYLGICRINIDFSQCQFTKPRSPHIRKHTHTSLHCCNEFLWTLSDASGAFYTFMYRWQQKMNFTTSRGLTLTTRCVVHFAMFTCTYTWLQAAAYIQIIIDMTNKHLRTTECVSLKNGFNVEQRHDHALCCGKWEIIKEVEKEEQSVVVNGQEQEHDHIINRVMCIMHTGIDNRNVMSTYDATTDSFICCAYHLCDRICMMVFSQTLVNSTQSHLCTEKICLFSCQVNRS